MLNGVEIVVAPVAQLRAQITHLFEETVGATLDRGAGMADEPHRFSCGLTGGSTALIFLGALREAAVAWDRITLYWGDERAVPLDHADSNFAIAERLLLGPLGARRPHALPMPADQPDLTSAARDYAAALPPALDLLILGIGEDGHVCSLFPGHKTLMDDTRVTTLDDAPKPPPRRMTLTMSYVLRARQIWVIALGTRKREVLQQAVSRGSLSTPLDMVVAQAKSVTVFTDQGLRRGFLGR